MEQNVPQLCEVEMASHSTGDSNGRTMMVMKTGPQQRDTLPKGSKLLIKKVHVTLDTGHIIRSGHPLNCTPGLLHHRLFIHTFSTLHNLSVVIRSCVSPIIMCYPLQVLCDLFVNVSYSFCWVKSIQPTAEVSDLADTSVCKRMHFRVVGNRTIKKNGKVIQKQMNLA